MGLSKPERISELFKRLKSASPFSSGDDVLAKLAALIRAVEDEHSGVPENPSAADSLVTDGRMYPPHPNHERETGNIRVRKFRQRRHVTLIGENGAIRVETLDGAVALDLAGSDGKYIAALFEEVST